MIGGIIFLVIIFLVLGAGWYMFRRGTLVANSIFGSIPIKYEAWEEGKLPLITLTSRHGTKYTFLVDTGANANYIDSTILPAFDSMEQNALRKETYFGSNGADSGGYTHQLYFTHRNVKLIDQYIATDMAAFSRLGEIVGQGVHGIVGTPFLHHHGLSVDLNRMVVWKKL